MEQYSLEFYSVLETYLKHVNKPSVFRQHPTVSGIDVLKFIDAYIDQMKYVEYKTKNVSDALSWKSYTTMNITNAVLFSHAISVLLKLKLCK